MFISWSHNAWTMCLADRIAAELFHKNHRLRTMMLSSNVKTVFVAICWNYRKFLLGCRRCCNEKLFIRVISFVEIFLEILWVAKFCQTVFGFESKLNCFPKSENLDFVVFARCFARTFSDFVLISGKSCVNFSKCGAQIKSFQCFFWTMKLLGIMLWRLRL